MPSTTQEGHAPLDGGAIRACGQQDDHYPMRGAEGHLPTEHALPQDLHVVAPKDIPEVFCYLCFLMSSAQCLASARSTSSSLCPANGKLSGSVLVQVIHLDQSYTIQAGPPRTTSNCSTTHLSYKLFVQTN